MMRGRRHRERPQEGWRLRLAGQHGIDLLALEERDADGTAIFDGLVGVAAADDHAVLAGMLDQLADMHAVVRHIVGPIDLHEIDAEIAAVHEWQAQMRQAVEADSIAALAREVAHIEEAAE